MKNGVKKSQYRKQHITKLCPIGWGSRIHHLLLCKVLYSYHHGQLYKHIIHIHLHMHAEHNDTIIDERHSSKKNIPLTLFERVMCERELEIKQNCNILTPTPLAITLFLWGCPRGVMVKAMNCGIVVREFVLQSRYYVHFRANTLGKGMNPLILLPAMGK